MLSSSVLSAGAGNVNSDELAIKVQALDTFLRRMQWVDFEVEQYTERCLTIKGSIDPSGLPDVQVHFEDVFFACLPFEWKTERASQVFGILQDEKAIQVNLRFQVEQGNYLFFFVPEDYPEDFLCLIAAKQFSWRQTRHQPN